MRPSSQGMRNTLSVAPPCSRHKVPRAHYRLASASVDVTDLLNSDFGLVDLIEGAIAHLGIASTAQPAQDLLGYAEQVLTLLLDLQSDKVLEIMARLSSAVSEQGAPIQEVSVLAASGVHTTGTEPSLHTACAELNRLKTQAQQPTTRR